MPKVSVIIPVYNTEPYLKRCLDSVINQTLSDIEIICIDANSTDNSLEILKKYTASDKRIKIIQSKERLTAGFARNLGIEIATGEYLGFIDSDDFIDIDFYELLYKKALETNADIVKSNLKNIGWNKNSQGAYYNLADVQKNKIKLNHIPTTIIKNSFIKKYNLKYPEDLSCAEDSVFEILVSMNADKIEIEENACYYYVFHSESLNHTKNVTLQKIQEVEKSLIYIINLLNASNLSENDYLDALEDRYKYLSIFINDKNPSNEIIEYVKTAEKEILSKLKYKERFINLEMQKKVKMLWMKKRIEQQQNEVNAGISALTAEFKNFSESGTTKIKRNPKFIVSLTSFPQRMQDIHICLHSLLMQSLKPDEIVLYLAQEQFPNKEKDIPNEVLKLKDFGLTIKFTNDIRSYKKLIPALKDYPNDIIITADDDIIYQKNWFEKLYNAYLEDNQNILCHRAHKIKLNSNNEIDLYKNWDKIIDDNTTSTLNFATGCAGILYPPNCFYKDILNEELFMKLAPNADDIWFWAMAVLNNRKIKIINEPIKKVQPVNMERECGLTNETTLYQTNIVENDIQLKAVVNQYPQIKNILLTELEGKLCKTK